jgi:crotonobetaine/carnitine-CoA ligase
MVLTEKFSLSSFWPDVRSHGATVFYYIGEILNLLVKADDAGPESTSLRAAWGVGGAPADVEAFARRHGIKIGTGYGSTEANVPTFRALGEEPKSASCGKSVPEFDVLVVDSDDKPVPVGETGEIVIRSSEPGSTLVGYDGDPEATRLAMRGGWFHSGDAGRFDERGNLYFAARLKDVIRVRGENVSAFEVEAVLLTFPGVIEAAAIAVPGELGGDDVKAVVVASEPLDPARLVAHCEAQLPKFSVPRYVERVDALPKTPTNKIQKHILRSHGVNARTWDSKSSSFNGKAQQELTDETI